MNVRGVLDGSAGADEQRKFWTWAVLVGLAVLAFGSLVGGLTVDVSGDPVYGLVFAVGAVGAAAALFGQPSVRRPGEYVALGAVALAGIMWITNTIGFEGWGRSFSLSKIAMLVVFFSSAGLLRHVLSVRAVAPPRTTTQMETATSAVTASDNVLYVAIGGAAAVVLSLLVLPWFKVDLGEWDGSISFNDLRTLYNWAKEAGFQTDVRFYFLEWGYLLSYAMAAFAVFVAFRARNSAAPFSRGVMSGAMGAAALMGIWQTVLAAGLTSLDEDGSVQIGAWLGVAGHVAVVAALVMMSRSRTPAVRPTAY